ncbi:hypothetical protein L2725_03195 [Shewanella corallii]|uniref:Uncharacterized protein n=1 Tax=Shewanella corallii TaxID=560080 RepID=A0ABT0N2X6_9GAMM|nr:hypothetical protein [Shewanella corallii]MCL2912798.1 hypothetical protein [Shewanella corallii]
MKAYDKAIQFTKGFSIKGAAIRDRHNIFLSFENHYDEDRDGDDWQQETRIVYYRPKTDKVWGGQGFNNFYRVMGVCLPDKQKTMLFTDWDGNAYKQGLSDGYDFIDVPQIPIEQGNSFNTLKCINGGLYIGGNRRSLLIKEENKPWHGFGPGGTAVEEESATLLGGTFLSFDGFAADDIYAAGVDGDCWHYNGQQWQPLDIPTDQDIHTVCCAGNGKVYLGCGGGILLEGRGDNWQQIPIKAYDDTTLITLLHWFQERLYIIPANSVDGAYEYDGKQLLPSQLGSLRVDTSNMFTDNILEAIRLSDKPGPTVPGAPNTICSCDDLLLVAGGNEVVVFDGTQWMILFQSNLTDAELEQTGWRYHP